MFSFGRCTMKSANQKFFDDIPPMIYPTVTPVLDTNINTVFGPRIQQFSNSLICKHFPIVAAASMIQIAKELEVALRMKKRSLTKLKRSYHGRKGKVNIVRDIYIDDYQMGDEDNVQLVQTAQAKLLSSTMERNLIQIIIKQFEAFVGGRSIEKDHPNVNRLLNAYCDNRLTVFKLEKQNEEPSTMVQFIVQVWQVFEQYFKQFDYLDYLDKYYAIKRSADVKFILAILRILVDVGRRSCTDQ